MQIDFFSKFIYTYLTYGVLEKKNQPLSPNILKS
jgi:hypothetical protein